MLDLAYLGVEKDYSVEPTITALPYKNKRNQKELPQEEKEYNKITQKDDSNGEHTICRLKKYWTISDVFRNKLKKYDNMADIAAGLTNHRIMNNYTRTDIKYWKV